MPMRVVFENHEVRLNSARAQAGFFIIAFLGLLFFGDRLGATTTGKRVRTGIQVPTNTKLSSVAFPGR
jgi:hypothetical protein